MTEQDDVLKKKGKTTEGSIGLQQWDDEDTTPEGHVAKGTSQRAAKLAEGQEGQADEE